MLAYMTIFLAALVATVGLLCVMLKYFEVFGPLEGEIALTTLVK